MSRPATHTRQDPGFSSTSMINTSIQLPSKSTLGRTARHISNIGLSKNPRTSMSQIKLSQLAFEQDESHDSTDDFGMKELRDGYYDPIYNRHENINKPDLSQDTEKRKQFRFDFSLDFKLNALRFLEGYFQNWKVLSKFTIAYLIAITLCLIGKSGKWLGDYRVFLPVATLLHHPVHPLGFQLEMTIQSIIGLAIGLGWSSLALYVSVATQPTRNHQGGILSGSLFIGIFLMGWFKGYFIRFHYTLLTSGLVLIFLSTCLELDKPVVKWKNCWDIGIPYLFGLLVSLLVSALYYPYFGPKRLMDSITRTTSSILDLLEIFTRVDTLSSKDEIVRLQKEAVKNTLKLSENFREFLSCLKLSIFKQEDLKEIRNHINFIVAPLRVIPFQSNLSFKDVKPEDVASTSNTKAANSPILSLSSSGVATPVPRSNLPINFHLHPKFNQGKEFVYVSIMNDTFGKPMLKLLFQMIESIKQIESALHIHQGASTSKELKEKELEKLEKSKKLLKQRISQLDVEYRKFSKSEYFCRTLLEQEHVINIFLFLRYSRQASVSIITLSDVVSKSCRNISSYYKPTMPDYPWKRAIRTLPEQSLRDQGADSVFHYMESRMDVDDAFERIYNLNTSRNKRLHHFRDQEKQEKAIRAIDHQDFNFHTTKNPIRYKIWKLSKVLGEFQTKYAFKVSFLIIFLSLPGWLPVSWSWYYTYNCNWCPLLVYFLLSPRNSGTWFNLGLRISCWLIGSFWGWAANQAGKSGGTVTIGVFAGIFSVIFARFFLVDAHPRSGLIGLLSFTIISLSAKIEADGVSSMIWKHAWITSLAVFVAVITSVFSNWLIWPFIAKKEVYKSCASVLSHIMQSYQSVSERYLYRDEDDDPTDLTLALANIREVRMSQNLVANEALLERAIQEHDFRHKFNANSFKQLLESCHSIMESLIEARMSSLYFHIWERDEDENTTNALLSLRRDSTAAVIYVLYMVSNSLGTKTAIPRYLPSSIKMRKKLFDSIVELEASKLGNEKFSKDIMDQLNEKLVKVQATDTRNKNGESEDEKDENSYMKIHWREVHGMAFSRAFTSITEEIERIVTICKEILGEEELLT